MKYKLKTIFVFAFVFVMFSGVAPVAANAADVQSQIQALMQQIAALQAQLKQLQSQQSGGQAWCYTFNKNLKIGDSGYEVDQLAYALKSDGSLSGAYADGDSFDEQLASSVVGFQEKYTSEILAPYGLKRGTGYVGPSTRAKLNALYGCKIEPKALCTQEYAPVCGKDGRTYSNQCFAKDSGVEVDYKGGCVVSINKPPVINEISGPTTLNVGQTGTWTIQASDPENEILSYSVIWGDEIVYGAQIQSAAPSAESFTQTVAFTHTYSTAGVYVPLFYVKDNMGNIAKTSISVNVGRVITPTVSEQVKCVFKSSISEQRCYTATNYTNPYYNYSCSGKETCIVDMRGTRGDKITWKSSCGGYAYTTMDGQSEYAEFNCATTQPSITVTSPNGGETWKIGETHKITWSWTNPPAVGTGNVRISLTGPNNLNQGLLYDFTTNNSTLGQGFINWTVPKWIGDWIKNSGGPNNQFRIKVEYLQDKDVFDSSDNYFSIVDSSTQPSISEQVKCVFKSSISEQRCYTATNYTNPYYNYSCSGKETCIVDMRGTRGDKITWKSSCGGYAYTTMDGQSEYAEFNCATTQPSITVTSPNGGEAWKVGSIQKISWETNNISSPNDKITIYMIPSDDPSKNVNLAQGLSNTGAYNYVVDDPSKFSNRSPMYVTGSQFQIFICAQELGTQNLCSYAIDYSDAPFTINKSTQPSITVTSPNGGDTYKHGDQIVIKWKVSGTTSTSDKLYIVIQNYGGDTGDGSIPAIYPPATIDGSYFYTIPTTLLPGSYYKVSVSGVINGVAVSDNSDNYFSIK